MRAQKGDHGLEVQARQSQLGPSDVGQHIRTSHSQFNGAGHTSNVHL